MDGERGRSTWGPAARCWGLPLVLFSIALVLYSIALALVLTLDVLNSRSSRTVGEQLTLRHRKSDPDPLIKSVLLRPADDTGKSGTVRGVMGWRYFEIPAGSSGPSQNQLRFEFRGAAEVLQIDISVDISDARANLVEFAAAINSHDGYGLDRRADWLMHASWARKSEGQSSALDETTRLPAGVQVGTGDFLGITAWLGGVGSGDPIRVSPEVVVLYRWI